MSQTPTLAEVILDAIRGDRLELHTSLPGVIESWDKATGRADIRLGVQTYATRENGQTVVREHPVLPSVPVAIPGGGKFRFGFPLKKGDPVEVIFQEASIDTWLAKGGGGLDPQDPRRHHISDAIAYPGPRVKGTEWTTLSDDNASFGSDTGPQYVAKESELHIGWKEGDTALTEKAVLGSQQKTDLDSFLQSLSTGFTSCASACTTAVTALTVVTTAITAAGTALSTPPLTPVGVLFTTLGTGLAALSSQLSAMGSQFTTMSTACSTLKGQLSGHLSGVVKLK